MNLDFTDWWMLDMMGTGKMILLGIKLLIIGPQKVKHVLKLVIHMRC